MNDQVILSVTKRGGGLEVTTRGTGHDQLAAIEAVAASAWRVMTANRNVPPDAATGVILLSVQRGIQTAAGKSGHMNMEEIERERRGEIRDLRLQVDFTLQEAYTDAEGRRVRAIRYRADFTYYEGTQGRQVVEDVKSRPTRTREYAMKKKMLKDRFGIDITEV